MILRIHYSAMAHIPGHIFQDALLVRHSANLEVPIEIPHKTAENRRGYR